MSMELGGVTAGIVGYALDGLVLRQSAIASNIANFNTPGYQPARVSFEQHFAAIGTASAAPASGSWSVKALPSPEVTREPAFGRLGLEGEVVQLNQTVLQYQALIRGLDRYMATVSTAINEGRR